MANWHTFILVREKEPMAFNLDRVSHIEPVTLSDGSHAIRIDGFNVFGSVAELALIHLDAVAHEPEG
jgi:hypothetical protein